MNEIINNIIEAARPLLYLVITAAVAFLAAYLRRGSKELKAATDSELLGKYMDMATEAVIQSVTYVAQTFVDALKAEGAFTKEKQVEAFNKAKSMVYNILGDTVVDALVELYGDFDAWITTKIEQLCREDKTPETVRLLTEADFDLELVEEDETPDPAPDAAAAKPPCSTPKIVEVQTEDSEEPVYDVVAGE